MNAPRLPLPILGLLILVSSNLVSAQESPQPPVCFVVYEEEVLPARIEEYRQASGERETLFGNFPLPVYPARNGNRFLYVFPVQGPGGLETYLNAVSAAETQAGEAAERLNARIAQTLQTRSLSMMAYRPGLSYIPEGYRGSAEMKFRRHMLYHVRPGAGHEFEALVRDYVALCREKNGQHEIIAYTPVTGEDLDVYLFGTFAQDRADYERLAARHLELIGEKGQALRLRGLALCRSFEQLDFEVLPPHTPAPK